MILISKSLFGSIPAVARSRLKKQFKLTISEIFVLNYQYIITTTYWDKIVFFRYISQLKKSINQNIIVDYKFKIHL